MARGGLAGGLSNGLESVTHAIAEALNTNPETVRVIIQEVPAESWGVGGIPVKERGR